jgi:hypothetical protein
MIVYILFSIILLYTTVAYDTFITYIADKPSTWEGIIPDNNSNTATAYNTNKAVKVKSTVIEPDKLHRFAPPRALFFGRFAGVEELTIGNYEEIYLNKKEMLYWKYQKEREEALAKGILNENK